MRNKKINTDEAKKNHDKERLYRLCKICFVGTMQLHPEFPHKFLKCVTCGNTIKIITSN